MRPRENAAFYRFKLLIDLPLNSGKSQGDCDPRFRRQIELVPSYCFGLAFSTSAQEHFVICK
ncbi:MAG: hypothetical protein A3G24_12815 [Betaproteobacteria bacterium RIFCSPLOWO2_12_FULL_62_13]|nr:MAG: hypothetical protein A3G24_12815 [Betaproteobacteria bacterium RIFCSPLOWO2_12_FULL_62_13]